ncbi:uncharacterized protein DNG_00004 [Cephalotrichum gorgonifer]|uniref:Uncharacterized protein n=1 Tax=Cephalotrichum gorgonifer TaxID=2041049 RepID=A0AAE8SQC8_9PEZI|nr:uncharacterized protein DNG_00004 [Cephalotrichum gorgonifer]
MSMSQGDFPTGGTTSPNVTAGLSYFDSSWSILSTIGMANVLFGFVIVGITSFKPVVAVPIVTSTACAVANGLSFYAFYTHYALRNRAVASAFADIFWLIQEAGLSFFSYVILIRVLHDKQRLVFLALFWGLMVGIVAARVAVLILRMQSILTATDNFQRIITRLHTAYFVLIASVECLSAFFLLRKFASAKNTSMKAALRTGIFHYLIRSTEVRVALLSLIGISRAVAYSFQTTAQSHITSVSQIDHFFYTMECLFPIILYFDILASKLRVNTQSSASYSRSFSNRFGMSQISSGTPQATIGSHEEDCFPLSGSEQRGNIVEVNSGPRPPKSQNHIFQEGQSSRSAWDDVYPEASHPSVGSGINKTVEFQVSNSPNSSV